MIKPPVTDLPRRLLFWLERTMLFPRHFKKVIIKPIEIRAGHSILLLQNHLSWWDGFWGNYLTYHFLKRKYHVMIQEDQLINHKTLRFLGGFSVRKNSRSMLESINYTAEILNDAHNLVLIFPQGRLQSNYAQEIEIQKGIYKVLEKIAAPCQVIYNAVTVDYLESFKPTITFNLLDCGDAKTLEPDTLRSMINDFHRKTLADAVRK